MENLNVRNVSTEELKSIPQYRKEPYSENDELQFKNWHEEKPTENWKQLQKYFDERAEIEKELRGLQEWKNELIEKGDELQKRLSEVQKRPTSSQEEEMKKQQELELIQNEIKEINEEVIRVKEKIEEKEQEFSKAIDKVEEAKELVKNDEHEQIQLDNEEYRRKKDAQVEFLMSQL
jgi:chromosome segregation ATPase